MNYEDRITKSYIEGVLGSRAKIVTGTYVGDGEASQFIPLPAKPSVLIVTMNGRLGAGNHIYGGVIYPDVPTGTVSISDSGFTAFGPGTTNSRANMANQTYGYLAIY